MIRLAFLKGVDRRVQWRRPAAERVRRSIHSDLEELGEKLALPAMARSLVVVRYIAYVGSGFASLTLLGWIYLLLTR